MLRRHGKYRHRSEINYRLACLLDLVRPLSYFPNLVMISSRFAISRYRVFFFVLESKNYSYGIKVTPHGEFESYDGKRNFGIESPLEQNKRHIHFLEDFLRSKDILPKRMGIPIRPKFHSLILISPKCIISRPPGEDFDTSPTIKADTLRTKLHEMIDQNSMISEFASLGKFSSSETVQEFAKNWHLSTTQSN